MNTLDDKGCFMGEEEEKDDDVEDESNGQVRNTPPSSVTLPRSSLHHSSRVI